MILRVPRRTEKSTTRLRDLLGKRYALSPRRGNMSLLIGEDADKARFLTMPLAQWDQDATVRALWAFIREGPNHHSGVRADEQSFQISQLEEGGKAAWKRPARRNAIGSSGGDATIADPLQRKGQAEKNVSSDAAGSKVCFLAMLLAQWDQGAARASFGGTARPSRGQKGSFHSAAARRSSSSSSLSQTRKRPSRVPSWPGQPARRAESSASASLRA